MGVLSNFHYWLNFNIFFRGHYNTTKILFYAFFFFFGLEGMKEILTIKMTIVIPPKNSDDNFTTRWCNTSPFGIIKIMIWSSWFKLGFETETEYIFFFLIYTTLIVIARCFFFSYLLLVSNLFLIGYIYVSKV